jgi:hypothetical protein
MPEDPCNDLIAPVTLCTAEFRPDSALLPTIPDSRVMGFETGTPLLDGPILT